MEIDIIGSGARLGTAARLLAEERDAPVPRLTLLPIPTSRDGVHVAGSEARLDELAERLEAGGLAVGYGLPASFTAALDERGIGYFDAARDELFLKRNAYVSALGVLGWLLSHSERTPDELRFGVVGYGRIGAELVRLLLFLGGRVRVFTSKAATRAALGELGIESAPLGADGIEAASVAGLDVLINTAPCLRLARAFPTGHVPEGLRVVDVASGESFAGVREVERLPAIPERLFPESGGNAYADAVRRALARWGKEAGE